MATDVVGEITALLAMAKPRPRLMWLLLPRSNGLDHSIRVWVLDGYDFRQVTHFRDERLGEIQGLVYCPNHSLLVATSGFGGRVWRWRWQDRLDREMEGLDGTASTALSLSPDGSHVAAADRKTTHIWKLGDQVKHKGTLDGRGPDIVSTAFTADGLGIYTGNVQGIVQSWKLAWRKFRVECTFAAHVGPVHALVSSPDCRHIATAGTDGAVRIWTVDREPDLEATISGGLRGVARKIVYLGRGESLLSISDAGQVAQWRAKDASKEAEWRLNQAVTSCQAIADQGRLVAVGRTDGTVHVYTLASVPESSLFSTAQPPPNAAEAPAP